MTSSRSCGRLEESLSAAIDGEATEMELHRVLANIQDKELRQTAKHYQLIGDALRKQNTPMMSVDLSDKIRMEIEAEPNINDASKNHASKKNTMNMTQSFGRVAVAASITLAVIVGVRTWNTDPIVQNTGNIQNTSSANASRNSLLLGQTSNNTQNHGARGILAGSQAEQTSLTPAQLNMIKSVANSQALERFKTYSLNHAEQLATKNIQGVLPFVRAVSFQSQ